MIGESELTQETYRSGEVAKLGGVVPRTVYTYFQKGLLKMHYTVQKL